MPFTQTCNRVAECPNKHMCFGRKLSDGHDIGRLQQGLEHVDKKAEGFKKIFSITKDTASMEAALQLLGPGRTGLSAPAFSGQQGLRCPKQPHKQLLPANKEIRNSSWLQWPVTQQ